MQCRTGRTPKQLILFSLWARGNLFSAAPKPKCKPAHEREKRSHSLMHAAACMYVPTPPTATHTHPPTSLTSPTHTIHRDPQHRDPHRLTFQIHRLGSHRGLTRTQTNVRARFGWKMELAVVEGVGARGNVSDTTISTVIRLIPSELRS